MRRRPAEEVRRHDGRVGRRRVAPVDLTWNARLLVRGRVTRAVGDGLVSVVLAGYLVAIGLSSTEVGIVVTATMLGSAALSLVVGFRVSPTTTRRVLQQLSCLMILTGIGLASFRSLWPIAIVGLVGTLNPTGNDLSAFQPTEQAALAGTVDDHGRTALFARYTVLGTFATAVGAALAGVPERLAGWTGTGVESALRYSFLAYAVLGAVALLHYRRLTDPSPPTEVAHGPVRSTVASRRTVGRLAALFSLDAFGGGFTVTAILVVWLQQRFEVSLAVSGAVLFWAGLLATWSQFMAPRLAARIGLVRTMSYTHLPANCLLVLAALMPTAPLAIACLLARAALSQMDVPARTSYVMAVVAPEGRAAAASTISVVRSLAAALPPTIAGWLLSRSSFGWPLIVAGTTKATYDILLLVMFRHLRPPEELPDPRPAASAPTPT